MSVSQSTEPGRPRAGRATAEDTALIAELTLEQKVRLLTGADAWTLHGEPAIGLRPIVMSDGPAGARGTRYERNDPSSSLPCPIALAATWDEELMYDVAAALGREARSKGVDVLLAPTMNIVRTPVSGRGFEFLSEDPLLTARMAVAYVRGVQASGVAATAKHFVANDTETERRTYDARISDRVLRELYLAPFEACVEEADVALVMASYNSVNGTTMTANTRLLGDVLKSEWGFEGVVVSDWHAGRTTVPSALGGLDLVMPGPYGPWGEHLLSAVRAGKVPEAVIDDKVARLLALGRRVGALDGSAPSQVSTPAGRELVDPGLLARAAARSFVLLTNRDALLPLDVASLHQVALIGPNAVEPTLQGGGSVRVLPVVRPSLAEALRATLGAAVMIDVHQGCSTSPTVPAPPQELIHDPETGEPGVRLQVRDGEGVLVHDAHFPISAVTWWDGLPAAVYEPGAEVLMRARYRPAADGAHLIGCAGVGLLSLRVNGAEVAEARTLPPRDVVEAFSRPPELRVPVTLKSGSEVDVAFACRPDARGAQVGFASMRLGIAARIAEDDLISAAAQAAARADMAVVVVGSPEGAESEGFDREALSLAARQDELVRRVAAVNPRTVVVVNSGMPVLMPWADEVGAIIQAWLPGQAFGEALAACLAGEAEPGGRLPLSIPARESDAPVLHARPDAGELPYAEGLLIGYRGYDRSGATPRFCFGHGLGYTEWTYDRLVAGESRLRGGEDLEVTVTVRNVGARAGHEVVQVYLEAPDEDAARPLRVLAGFSSVEGGPGQLLDVRIRIPSRAFAVYEEAGSRWTWRPGLYTLHAGRSSRDLFLAATVELT